MDLSRKYLEKISQDGLDEVNDLEDLQDIAYKFGVKFIGRKYMIENLLKEQVTEETFLDRPIRGVKDLIMFALPTEKDRGDQNKVVPWINYIIDNDKVIPVCNILQGIKLFAPYLKKEDQVFKEVYIKYQERECKNKFIIIQVLIYTDLFVRHGQTVYRGHYNVVIIDKQNKTVERFEPNGNYSVSDFVDKIVQETIADPINYTYLPPLSFCPKIGPQQKQAMSEIDEFTYSLEANPNKGYCVTWSALYAHLRLRNPNWSPNEIIDYLLSFSSKQLSSIILRYQGLMDILI